MHFVKFHPHLAIIQMQHSTPILRMNIRTHKPLQSRHKQSTKEGKLEWLQSLSRTSLKHHHSTPSRQAGPVTAYQTSIKIANTLPPITIANLCHNRYHRCFPQSGKLDCFLHKLPSLGTGHHPTCSFTKCKILDSNVNLLAFTMPGYLHRLPNLQGGAHNEESALPYMQSLIPFKSPHRLWLPFVSILQRIL